MRVPVMYPIVVAFLLLTVPRIALAQSVDYEIFALRGDERDLLASGKRQYSIDDIHVVTRHFLWQRFWQKSVPLWEDFSVGASVYQEKTLDGFGLWIKKGGGGFSWEWFCPESGSVYRKLQGPGHVRVTLAPTDQYKELVAVEFLQDVTLSGRFGEPFSYADTHHVVIKKGSVLRLAP